MLGAAIASSWNLAARRGLSFVDAGMRQLNRTGWMHNRLRMVTAQFLAKHLFIDWRLGSVLSQLIGGDFPASGDGGECVDGGMPNRMLILPSGQRSTQTAFLAQQIPGTVAARQTLTREFGGVENYPKPMIDLSAARDKTLQAWKIIKG